MIITITFNPTLDLTGEVDELIPNEKSYVHNEHYTAGGNGINAGVIAANLKSSVLLSGFLGGANGEAVKTLLLDKPLKHDFISVKGSTRLNVTVSNRSSHKQTRLSFTGPRVTKGNWLELVKMVKSFESGKHLFILGGSLPPGISTASVSSLIRSIKKKFFCMVDMPGNILKDVIHARPDFIKPNLLEFQELCGKKITSKKDVLREIKKLLPLVPLICVSSVDEGTMLVREDQILFAKTPRLKILSTLGAGDSMVGAMATLLEEDHERPLIDLIRLGMAASCATLTSPNLTLGSRQMIESYRSKIKIESL